MKNFLFLLLVSSTLLAGTDDNMTTITTYRNQQVKKLRPILDQWAIDAYREYPYLYVFQGETDYNSMFEVDPDALVLFGEKEGKKLALLQANPLDSPCLADQAYTPSAYLDEIRQKGYKPEEIYYISSFLLQKEERANQTLALALFDQAVSFAKTLGKSKIAYMEIIQDTNHPLKPASHLPCEPWAILNLPFTPMGVHVTTSWPTLKSDGTVHEEAHTLALYVMDI